MTNEELKVALLEVVNASAHPERDGAESFGGRHIQTGIVGYPEMKHPITGRQGIDVLVEKPVLDAMRHTMRGVPIFNGEHRPGDVSDALAKGEAVGVMVGSRWEGEDAWEHCDYFVWDKEAKANIRAGYRLSNAWLGDDVDWTPGVHNGKTYDGRLKAAHYTHMAIVPVPRYEGAVIYANSKGGLTAMLKLFGIGKTEAVELDKEAALEVGGKKYKALEVVNAMAAIEAEKAKVSTTAKAGALKDDDTVQIGDKKYTGLEVANAMAAIEKAAVKPPVAPAPVAEAAKKIEHTAEEFQNAVDARVKEALDKAVGDGFFNGIAKLAQTRPGAVETAPKIGRNSEKQRLEHGRKRFGSKKPVAA